MMTIETVSTAPMTESIKLALQASNLSYESLNSSNNVLQNNASDAKGYISTLNLLAKEQGVAPLGAKDMKLLEYFAITVHPLFVKTVTYQHAREGQDLFVEATAHLENSLLGPYFGGSKPNLVDYGLFPWFNKMGSWLPTVTASECPQITSWLRRMRQDSVVAKVETTNFDATEIKKFQEEISKERSLG